jgi:hypothetical protein
MAYTIGQIAATAYPAVLASKKKPANQWEESALLHELERQGGIEKMDFGSAIEVPVDYQRNPGTVIQATDLQPLSLAKTEVVTSASYSIAEIVAPVTWSQKDEVQTPSQNQKIAFVDTLLTNAFDSHDDILEANLFNISLNGFLGLGTHVTASGNSGVDGGIDSGANTMWRNQQALYTDDTDIESAFTTVWNQCAKGSGSKLMPTLMVADAPTQALFEGTQQANQRWIDTDELKAGFKILAFKTARFVFSQYADPRVYFLNTKSYKLCVSKGHYREKRETVTLPNQTGWSFLVYTAAQTVVNNRSRLGIAHVSGAL